MDASVLPALAALAGAAIGSFTSVVASWLTQHTQARMNRRAQNQNRRQDLDYTIIGAEVNLTARLQSIAEPGRIVMSYETYALVRQMVAAYSLPPITMKGIARKVVPYVVEGMLDGTGAKAAIFSEHLAGIDFYFDPTRVAAETSEHLRNVLQQAIALLDERRSPPRGSHPDDWRAADASHKVSV
jgi:hypothetical protein